MAYLELFRCVRRYVRELGAETTFRRGPSLTVDHVERVCGTSAIPVPNSVADLYLECGDGVYFSWEHGDASAAVSLPPLSDLAVPSLDKVNWRIEWSDTYDFRYTRDPTLAKQTAMRMRQWLPIFEEGNGDSMCVDTASDPAPVVFNRHDWFDGGTGENGHVLGDSLLGFLTAWSSVCFQGPGGHWWPSVFRQTGGIDWSNAEFRDPFRLTNSGTPAE